MKRVADVLLAFVAVAVLASLAQPAVGCRRRPRIAWW